MSKEKDIATDDNRKDEGTLRPGAVRKKGNDNQLLIIVMVLLGIIALLGVFQAHWGVIILTALVEGILIYKLNNGKNNI